MVKKAWVAYSIGGLLNTLSVLLHLYGLRYGDLTIVIPLAATAPLWALLFTAIFLRKIERELYGQMSAQFFLRSRRSEKCR